MILQPTSSTYFPYTTLFRSSEYKEMKLTDDKIINIETEYIYYLSEGTAQLWELHSDGGEILINVLKPDDAIRLPNRSEEHTSELQSRGHLVFRLLLEKKKIT